MTAVTPNASIVEKVGSASFGAVLTSLAVTPLDVIKVRIQSQEQYIKGPSGTYSNPREVYVYCSRLFDDVEPCRSLVREHPLNAEKVRLNGVWDGAVKIIRHEGLSGLWRGLSPTLMMSIPATVVYFVGYEQIRRQLCNYESKIFNSTGTLQMASPFIAGSLARIVAATFISPLELLRTKMQYHGLQGTLSTISRDLFHTVKMDGLAVLWKGLVPTLWRDVPFSAIYWLGFETIKDYLEEKSGANLSSSTRHLTIPFISGAISGMIAAAITTPFDVAKTRSQVDSSRMRRTSILKQLNTIWTEEGVVGVTRGIVPRMFKVAPACAIMISSYEMGKLYLGSIGNVIS